MKILITGANGQLGKCIRDISNLYPEYNFPSELFSQALVGKSVVPAGMELQIRTDGAVLLEYN